MRAKREPSADIRRAAAAAHEVYTALRDEGFSEKQSLILVGQMFRQAGSTDGES